jgi:hypothetical protein
MDPTDVMVLLASGLGAGAVVGMLYVLISLVVR